MTVIKPQRGLDPIKAYVPGKPIEEVQREYGLQDVIKLASNENPMEPPPKTLAALKDALCRLNSYPDGQSYYLRQALAARLGVKPEQVTVGNGADGIIMQVCLAYLDDASEVIVSQSSFPVYDIYTYVMRAKLIKIDWNTIRVQGAGRGTSQSLGKIRSGVSRLYCLDRSHNL